MITFIAHSGIYTLETKSLVKTSIDQAWDYFSSPQNLEFITPKEMNFNITYFRPVPMYKGMLITYVVGIFPGFKSNWVTEITAMKENKYFVDEQRFGPYSMWHHEHHFKAVDGGVEMVDIVSYKLPFGAVGRLFHFLVKSKLRQIFTYRASVLITIFP